MPNIKATCSTGSSNFCVSNLNCIAPFSLNQIPQRNYPFFYYQCVPGYRDYQESCDNTVNICLPNSGLSCQNNMCLCTLQCAGTQVCVLIMDKPYKFYTCANPTPKAQLNQVCYDNSWCTGNNIICDPTNKICVSSATYVV